MAEMMGLMSNLRAAVLVEMKNLAGERTAMIRAFGYSE